MVGEKIVNYIFSYKTFESLKVIFLQVVILRFYFYKDNFMIFFIICIILLRKIKIKTETDDKLRKTNSIKRLS